MGRTAQQRAMFIQDLILKYPDILTRDEKFKLDRWKDAMMAGFLGAIFAMPYSLYLAVKARSRPLQRTKYIK
jgi:hypothetical protein